MPSGARLGRATILLAACGLVSACGSTNPSDRSALQQQIGTPGGISATELRLRLYELPQQLGGIVEVAADRIRSGSSDPAIRRRALLWEADGIPALYAAALRPDPLVGGLDLAVFVYQMAGLRRGRSRKRRLRSPAGDRRRCGPADGEAHRKHGFLSLHGSSGLPPATGQAPGVRPRTPDRRVLPGTRNRPLRARPLCRGRERRSARLGRPGHGHSGRHHPAAERLHHASAQGDAVAGGARRGRHCGPRQPGRHSRRRPCHRRGRAPGGRAARRLARRRARSARAPAAGFSTSSATSCWRPSSGNVSP